MYAVSRERTGDFLDFFSFLFTILLWSMCVGCADGWAVGELFGLQNRGCRDFRRVSQASATAKFEIKSRLSECAGWSGTLAGEELLGL